MDLILTDEQALDEEDLERGRTDPVRIRQFHLVPGCCPATSTHEPVYILARFDSDDVYEKNGVDCKPRWRMSPYSTHQWLRPRDNPWTRDEDQPSPVVCPFCTQPLPKIVLRKVPLVGPVRSITDGGDYCDTCRERLMCCACWPHEAKWQVLDPEETRT